MKIRLLLASVLMTVSVFGQNVPSYVPTNGLVGWWPFNGNANDESGNGNNGTVNGGTILTSDRFSIAASAYQVDGVNCSGLRGVSLPMSIDNTGEYSVSVWFQSSDTAKTNQCIMNSLPERVIGIGVNRNPPCPQNSIFSLIGDGTNWSSLPDVCFPMNSSIAEWHNMIFVKRLDTVFYYIDGQLSYSQSLYPTLNVGAFTLVMGSVSQNLGPLCYESFKGPIDDIGIWNRALTQQEITNLYNASLPSTSIPIFNCPGAFMSPQLANGLVGWWPFCGDADDESGNGNNGTVNGATLTSDRFGNVNSAYEFDGVDDYIIGNADNLPSQERTVSVWFYTTNLGSGPSGRAILGYGGQNCGESWNMHLDNSGSQNGQDSYEVNSHCNVFSVTSSYGVNPPVGAWHNWLVLTHPNGTRFYVDGQIVLDTNVFINSTFTLLKNFTFGCYTNTNGIGPLLTDPNNTPWDGVLDDIGIWNRALDSSEVVQLYNTGLCTQTIAGSCDTLIFNANITGFNPVAYANQVKMYPNPASDNLVIDCGTNYTGLNGYSIRITNLLGQTVYNSPVTAQITNIQLTPPTWVNGTYVVQFVHPNGTVVDTKRIIIQ